MDSGPNLQPNIVEKPAWKWRKTVPAHFTVPSPSLCWGSEHSHRTHGGFAAPEQRGLGQASYLFLTSASTSTMATTILSPKVVKGINRAVSMEHLGQSPAQGKSHVGGCIIIAQRWGGWRNKQLDVSEGPHTRRVLGGKFWVSCRETDQRSGWESGSRCPSLFWANYQINIIAIRWLMNAVYCSGWHLRKMKKSGRQQGRLRSAVLAWNQVDHSRSM